MSETVGLAAAAGAVVLFGSFPLATKTSKTGDGVVFQWCMCAGIYTVGVITFFTQCSTEGERCPQFIPLAAVGGAIWCASNLFLVPIVDCIGIGMSMMLWGMNEMLAGWATGRFGLFHTNAEPIAYPWLNSLGVVIAVASLVVLVAIRPDTLDDAGPGELGSVGVSAAKHIDEDGDVMQAAPLIRGDSLISIEAGLDPGASLEDGSNAQPSDSKEDEDGGKWTDRLTPRQRRIFGVCACVVAGFMSGSTFTPPQAVVDATANWMARGAVGPAPYPGASTSLFDLLMSHFTGIMLSSTVFVMVYAAARRNRPQVFAQSVLPAYVSGLVWGVAMVCWFIANANLEIVIAFPIVTLGPGICNMGWGILLFKEVTGKRNFALLAASVVLYLTASVAIVLSKTPGSIGRV